MAHIEVKARCPDLQILEQRLQELQKSEPDTVKHVGTTWIKDTYFQPGLPDSDTLIKIRIETPENPSSSAFRGKHSRRPQTGEAIPLDSLPLFSRGELIIYSKRPVKDDFFASGNGVNLSVLEMLSPEHAHITTDLLKRSNPIKTVVEKKRTLFWIGQTRVHLDEVAGLGKFVELEYKLNDPSDRKELGTAQRELHRLMETLGIASQDIVPQKSYSTMLSEQQVMQSPFFGNELIASLPQKSQASLRKAPKSLFPADTFVIQKGPTEDDANAYLILSGNVRVFADKDCTQLIAERHPGEIIGDLALSTKSGTPNLHRNAYVQTTGPLEVVQIHQKLWHNMVREGGADFLMKLLEKKHTMALQMQ